MLAVLWTSGGRISAYTVGEMPRTIKSSDYVCPVCKGRGRVPGRLPGRKQLCDECHGTGRIAPIRREVLVKKLKERASLALNASEPLVEFPLEVIQSTYGGDDPRQVAGVELARSVSGAWECCFVDLCSRDCSLSRHPAYPASRVARDPAALAQGHLWHPADDQRRCAKMVSFLRDGRSAGTGL